MNVHKNNKTKIYLPIDYFDQKEAPLSILVFIRMCQPKDKSVNFHYLELVFFKHLSHYSSFRI